MFSTFASIRSASAPESRFSASVCDSQKPSKRHTPAILHALVWRLNIFLSRNNWHYPGLRFFQSDLHLCRTKQHLSRSLDMDIPVLFRLRKKLCCIHHFSAKLGLGNPANKGPCHKVQSQLGFQMFELHCGMEYYLKQTSCRISDARELCLMQSRGRRARS